ncbi:Uncharacterised protein [Legionella cincinnatiensis]|uniref:Uncharacterized protein n=1 Tax=Legionella cincinnatiensis TaxID=28085 RepID=A0A378IPK2_9GAMM|nr:hypothetical protein Lcin_2722 [Legionella cincinnatiensis]STX36742.1 Uncharacterised protein [Legionella cincinnatiensis]
MMSNPEQHDRTNGLRVLILLVKIELLILRHCWKIAVTHKIIDDRKVILLSQSANHYQLSSFPHL